MTRIDEIAADIFRISTYASDIDIQSNQFPLGPGRRGQSHRSASLRYVGFSHYEPDDALDPKLRPARN